MFSDEQYVTRMVRAGAKGYLTKDTVERDLIQAIRAVDAGQSFFSPAICKILLHNVSQELNGWVVEDRYESLTDRERQVFQLLAEGKTNKGIAEMLNLSLHTVETHRFRVMEKLAVHSSAELVIFAVRRGLLSYLAPQP
jgi:DNA-binding NarL/FixJ family response regulator